MNDYFESWEAEREHEREDREFEAFVSQIERDELRAEVEELKGRMTPPIPIPDPGQTTWPQAAWDSLFHWYHRYGKPAGMTLRTFSDKLDRAYGTVKNQHMQYRAEHISE